MVTVAELVKLYNNYSVIDTSNLTRVWLSTKNGLAANDIEYKGEKEYFYGSI